MASRGLRICVVGATGALGSEVLALLDASALRIAEILPVASATSLGADIEFQGEMAAVATELPALQGLDLVLCCAPRTVAPEIARAALHAEVPCIDVTGAWTLRDEVPLVLASCGDAVPAAPLLAGPADAALVWAPVLRALAGAASLVRVTGAILEAASAGGRADIEALSAGSLALFNQQDPPEEARERPLAFDGYPSAGAPASDSAAAGRSREAELAAGLHRLLGREPALSARWMRIPAFVGQMSCLWVELAEPVEASAAAERLAKAPGVELWTGPGEGPNLRAVSGRSVVLVGPPGRDPAQPHTLRLWMAGDLLRLAAANAVALASARLAA